MITVAEKAWEARAAVGAVETTKLPLPRIRFRTPRRASSETALLAVIRETENIRASSVSDGMRVPTAYSPLLHLSKM